MKKIKVAIEPLNEVNRKFKRNNIRYFKKRFPKLLTIRPRRKKSFLKIKQLESVNTSDKGNIKDQTNLNILTIRKYKENLISKILNYSSPKDKNEEINKFQIFQKDNKKDEMIKQAIFEKEYIECCKDAKIGGINVLLYSYFTSSPIVQMNNIQNMIKTNTDAFISNSFIYGLENRLSNYLKNE